jgi:hypothetical protein
MPMGKYSCDYHQTLPHVSLPVVLVLKNEYIQVIFNPSLVASTCSDLISGGIYTALAGTPFTFASQHTEKVSKARCIVS